MASEIVVAQPTIDYEDRRSVLGGDVEVLAGAVHEVVGPHGLPDG
ncbi:hypothetical protein GCM10010372_43950 [Streptomyces tauricus]|nr:hypothetical protein GCM10010372_43950 [Streptomyces tauricus]